MTPLSHRHATDARRRVAVPRERERPCAPSPTAPSLPVTGPGAHLDVALREGHRLVESSRTVGSVVLTAGRSRSHRPASAPARVVIPTTGGEPA